MKQQKKTILKFICILSLGTSIQAFCQLQTVCGEYFIGVGEADIECYQEIIVTSSSSESTIISGEIYSYVKINLIPGNSGIRLIPVEEETITRDEGEGGKKRTRLGTGGKTGDRYSSPDIAESEQLIAYPNPANNVVTFSTTNQNIKTINLYSISGKVLINQKWISQNAVTLNISGLENGLYIIKAQLTNDSVITKTIVKQ